MNRSTRPVGLILGVFAVLFTLVLVFRSYLGDYSGLSIPNTGGFPTQNNQQQGRLGSAFAASGLDQNGCPAKRADQFLSNQPIYVGFTAGEIPRGTSLFARFSREGQTLKDAREITASEDLHTCVSFVFKPTRSAAGFEPGIYQVDLYVNGNRAKTLWFTINLSDSISNGSPDLQLGQLVITNYIDSKGCPGEQIAEFRSNQAIYAAFDQSFIPGKTEIFARLQKDGRVIEDTKTVSASQDVSSCVWFEFKTSAQDGLPPGTYRVEMFVNGSRADSAQFDVR